MVHNKIYKHAECNKVQRTYHFLEFVVLIPDFDTKVHDIEVLIFRLLLSECLNCPMVRGSKTWKRERSLEKNTSI